MSHKLCVMKFHESYVMLFIKFLFDVFFNLQKPIPRLRHGSVKIPTECVFIFARIFGIFGLFSR